jgi:ectoine hydroxylase-related dioxygenase (phytanoyl-CoA dioxygenase family)
MTTTIASTVYTITDLRTNQPVKVTPDELRTRFERDGVLVIPNFLSDAQMQPLRREMEAHYAPRAASAATSHQGNGQYAQFECDVLVWMPLGEGNAEFIKLNELPALRHVTEEVIGPGYTTSKAGLVMYCVAGGRGQAWHQDCPPDTSDPKAFNLNRLFYTSDVSLQDGAIVFVPGSHRMGRIPPGGHQDPIEGERVLEPRAGTLVLLHGNVYHRVTPNLNNKPRTSINIRTYPAGTPTSVTCIGVYRNGDVNFCDTAKTHDGKPAVLTKK